MFQQMVVAPLIMRAFLPGCALLLGGWFWWQYRFPKKWLVLFASCLLVAFLISSQGVINHYEQLIERYSGEIERLRTLYPVESLEDRLPSRRVLSRSDAALSQATCDNLSDLENKLSYSDDGDREKRLQKLHEGSVDEFVRRSDFGVARMTGRYSESVLENRRGDTSIRQPSSDISAAWTQIDLDKKTDVDSIPFLSAHAGNVLHFVNPAGFGFMKDRQQVAGFQAHQFNELTEPAPWKILRLELLGLLLADKPRVYVTEELPRMEKIRAVPTRVLDVFETAGLVMLHEGEELFIRETPQGIRMLGAIRSVKQCIKCHGGERGELLGAFSYFLTPMP